MIIFLMSSLSLVAEGIWSVGLFHHWTFFATVFLALLSSGIAPCIALFHGSAYAFISHAGLFLVLSGGFFGAPDRTDVRMTVFENGSAERLAYGHDGNLVCLPFSVALEDFSIDCYDDGTSPKQYTSLLSCDGNILKTSVNHPCRYKGYSIFQSGYDIVRRQFPPIVKSEPSYV